MLESKKLLLTIDDEHELENAIVNITFILKIIAKSQNSLDGKLVYYSDEALKSVEVIKNKLLSS